MGIITKTEKRCNDCGVTKPVNAFPPNKTKPDGMQSYCRTCWQRRNREYQARKANPARNRRVYKDVSGAAKLNRCLKDGRVTIGQYKVWVNEQNGVCAICGQPPVNKRLSIDHDHQTGKIRGLLCSACNLGLGWFKDDAERLRLAAEYLDRAA